MFIESVLLFFFVGRMGGEEKELMFCERKQVTQSVLRMTWEAKSQLKEILVNEVIIMFCTLYNFYIEFLAVISIRIVFTFSVNCRITASTV